MERLNYEKILFENLSEGAFAMITKSEKDFADWIESIKYQSKRCDELYYELKKYKDAEEQGLLLRLPCKVGDTVYIVMRLHYRPDGLDMSEYKEIEEVKVDNITIGKPYWQINYDEHEFLPEDFGKSIFLTKEEAEQELANRQQSHAEAIMDERNGR